MSILPNFGKSRGWSQCRSAAPLVFVLKKSSVKRENKLRILRGPSSTLYSVDHVFTKSRSHETTVIIYGELGSETWLSLHLAAKKLAKNNKAKYVFRHWSKVCMLIVPKFQ